MPYRLPRRIPDWQLCLYAPSERGTWETYTRWEGSYLSCKNAEEISNCSSFKSKAAAKQRMVLILGRSAVYVVMSSGLKWMYGFIRSPRTVHRALCLVMVPASERLYRYVIFRGISFVIGGTWLSGIHSITLLWSSVSSSSS